MHSIQRLSLSLFLLIATSFSEKAFSSENQNLPTAYCQFNGKKTYQSDHSQKFPKKVDFTCGYNCKLTKQKSLSVLASYSVLLHNMREEAVLTTCEGVELKNSKWGYELGEIHSFYVYTTHSRDFRAWAKEHIPRQKAVEEKMLLEAQSKIYQAMNRISQGVGPNNPSSSHLVEAIERLAHIAVMLPKNTELLDYYLQLDNNQLSIAETLVRNTVHNTSFWRK